MTSFEALWEDYLNKDITTMSDRVIAFFSSEIPDEIERDYDVRELAGEFIGHHEEAKKFDKLIEFSKVFKENNRYLYDDLHSFLNEALVHYYCFKRDFENLRGVVDEFIEAPMDYDLLLKSFKKILYYGQTELADRIIENKYEEVQQSDDLNKGAEFDLALVKLNIELERFCASVDPDKEPIDWSSFKEKMALYDFKFDDKYLQAIESAIKPEASKELLQELSWDHSKGGNYILLRLEILFSKRMWSKNTGFPISGSIWSKMVEYWDIKEKRIDSWQEHFKIERSRFSDFLKSKSGFFLDYRFEQALLLWGSSYVIDFLYEMGLFSPVDYEYQKQIISDLKNAFIGDNEDTLWEYDFILDWLPPEGVSPEDQLKEKEVFTNSFDLLPPRDHSHELSLEELIQDDILSPKPYRAPRKIGRNEKVSVKYTDGKVVKDVKYKKVLKDLEEGNCELI
jgi:hypothetical protein